MVRKLIYFCFLIIILSCASTKTSLKQYKGLDDKVTQRDFAGAINKIKRSKDKYYTSKEKVVYYLDRGMLHFYNRDYGKSNEYLTKAENAIDENYTKSISKAAISLLLNDNALDYAGEDYEDIYLNIFKALNYIELGNFDDAFVEIRRIEIKLNKLEDKYKKMAKEYDKSKDSKIEFKAVENRFHNDALGRYLSLLIYRAEGKWDDARIDLDLLKDAWIQQSHIYDFKTPQFDDYLLSSKKAKIDFISFIGKSPVKKAKTLYVHTEKDIIIIASTEQLPEGQQELEGLHIIPWEGVKKGYHFKFQLPYMKERESDVAKVKIIVDNKPVIELKKIEDMGKVALETYKIKEPLIYLKTIIRTTVKGLFAEKRKEEMEEKINDSFLGFAARLATDIVVDATENADLRISRFFPGDALVGEIKVEPGLHNIKIEYYSRNGSILFIDDLGEKEIKKDGLNLFNSFYLN